MSRMQNSLILAKAAHSAVTPAAASAINTVATVTQYLGFVGVRLSHGHHDDACTRDMSDIRCHCAVVAHCRRNLL